MYKDDLKGIGIGFGIGVVVGALFGILYAPKAGKETRMVIYQKAKEIGKKAKVLRDKAGKFVKKGK